jgi:arylsulfatase A
LELDGRSFLPQLRGKRGNPREWIYCWHSRNGINSEAKEFARNHRYKLYRTGEFYDVQNDEVEEKALRDSELSREARKVRRTLRQVLDKYEHARPNHLGTSQ